MIRPPVAVLAVLVVGALAVGSPAVAVAAEPTARTAGTGAELTMTIETPSGPVSLQDPAHPVGVHLTGRTGTVEVVLTIDPEAHQFYGYQGRIEAPDAPGGFRDSCQSASVTVIDVFHCAFDVPIRDGVNRIDFIVAAFGIEATRASGTITGVPFGVDSWIDVQLEDGSWLRVPNRGDVAIAGRKSAALRYVVQNQGSAPFRVEGACSPEEVAPGGELVCGLRGPRPVIALAGEYSVPLTIRDGTASPVSLEVVGRITVGPEDAAAREAAAAARGREPSDAAILTSALLLALLATASAVVLRQLLRLRAPTRPRAR